MALSAVLLALRHPTPATAQAPAAALDAGQLRQQAEQLRRDQHLPEALAAYRTLAALEPASFEDRFWVAKLEGWTGNLAPAESAFVQLLTERPADYDSRIALADVRLWRGDTAGSHEVLVGLERDYPNDPEVLHRLATLRQRSVPDRWEADLEYFGERLPGGATTNGAALSLAARASSQLRWRAGAAVQEKFDQTETRAGAEIGVRPTARLELTGSAYVAPGAEVLPRGSYGLGASHRVARGVVLYAEYGFLDYHDASVHQVGPMLELYPAAHWFVAGRYRYIATRFDGAASAVGDHAGSFTVGYLYGLANQLRVFAAAGGESFTQPSRDLIGRFEAHTVGLALRHFLTPGLGLELLYAHQDRLGSDGNQDSYSLRVLRRW